ESEEELEAPEPAPLSLPGRSVAAANCKSPGCKTNRQAHLQSAPATACGSCGCGAPTADMRTERSRWMRVRVAGPWVLVVGLWALVVRQKPRLTILKRRPRRGADDQ